MALTLRAICIGMATVCLMGAVAGGAAAVEITSAKGNYPVQITGTSTADVMDKFGSQIKCTNNTFAGTLTAKSTGVTFSPTYTGCTGFGLPSTFTMEPSTTLITFSDGSIHILKAYTEHIYSDGTHKTTLCTNETFPQTPSGKLTTTNNADGTITISGSITGITTTQERKSIFCPSGTHTSTATYTIQAGGIKLSGTFNGAPEGIHVK